jgi:hypothetical protein
MNELIQIDNCELTPTDLKISDAVDIFEWKQIGHKLCRCQAALQWWVGDWINHGEAAYGNKYKEAINIFGEESSGGYGYTPEQLRVYASVANRVVKRLTTVSWSHHFIVAPMPTKEQQKWLSLSDKNKWTVKQLKEAIKAEYCDPSAGVSHKTSFSWLTWVTQGERWLNNELRNIGEWDLARIEALKRDLERIVPLKQIIDSEYEKRIKAVEAA